MNQDQKDIVLASPADFSHEELVYALEKIDEFDSFLESIIQNEPPTQLILEKIGEWFLEEGFEAFGIRVDYLYESYEVLKGLEGDVFDLPVCPENHFRYLLVVSERSFGNVALKRLPHKDSFSEKFWRYLGNLLMEDVDNLLYMRGIAIIKQYLIEKIQDEFQNETLAKGIELILNQLKDLVDFKHVVVCFEEFAYPCGYQLKTLFFEEAHWISPDSSTFQSIGNFLSKVVRVTELEAQNLRLCLDFADIRCREIYVPPQREPVGKVFLTLDAPSTSSFLDDILEILVRALVEVLTKHFHDKTNLSRHFSPIHVERLLDLKKRDHHLNPRERECGILYADISGFTSLSEKVLKTPEKIANFVNQWSTVVLEILYAHGGTYDKLVGDCMIGIFGPPFFDWDRQECIRRLTKAAIEISRQTRNMCLDDELRERIHSEMPEGYCLGVTTGVKYAPLFVGRLGPGRSYSGLSSGMNQTARLQGLAVNGEILFLEHMIKDVESLGLVEKVEGPFSQKVKNVSNALNYYKICP